MNQVIAARVSAPGEFVPVDGKFVGHEICGDAGEVDERPNALAQGAEQGQRPVLPPQRGAITRQPSRYTTGLASRLFRIRHGQVRVSFEALGDDDKRRGERIRRLVQDLDVIGVKVVRNKPRAPLEFLAHETTRDRFLSLMGQVLEP